MFCFGSTSIKHKEHFNASLSNLSRLLTTLQSLTWQMFGPVLQVYVPLVLKDRD